MLTLSKKTRYAIIALVKLSKEYGKGRVFYTAFGHRDEVWADERFQKLMLGGLGYVIGPNDGSGKTVEKKQ